MINRYYGFAPKMDVVSGTLHAEGVRMLDDLIEEFRSGRAIDIHKLCDIVLSGDYHFTNPEMQAVADEIYWDARWKFSEARNE